MTTFKLLPVEATEGMAYAGYKALEPIFAEDGCEPNTEDWKKAWRPMCEAALSPWRPIEEAEEMEDVLAWPVNGRIGIVWFEDGSRPSKYPRGWYQRDTGREVNPPTRFIPLSALGIPGEADPLDRTEQGEATQQHTGET